MQLVTILTLAIELGVRVERILDILKRTGQLSDEQAADYEAKMDAAFGADHWRPSTKPPVPPPPTK